MKKIISLLLFFYLVFFPFGQLNRLPINFSESPEIKLYLTDILLFLLLLFWMIEKILSKKDKYQFPFLTQPIIIFFLTAAISLILNFNFFSQQEILIAVLYLIRWGVYAGLYFVIFDLKNRFKHLRREKMIEYLIALGTIIAFFGLLQYFFFPNLRPLEVLNWDPHDFRLVGTFLDPGFIGIILVLTLVLIVLTNQSLKSYLLFALNYLALALTYSRSSYLAYLASMFLIAWGKKSKKFFAGIILLAILTFLLLPKNFDSEGVRLGRTSTLQARIETGRQAMKIALKQPFFGVGFNTYRYAKLKFGNEQESLEISHSGAGADSSFLFVLVTTGIIGLLSYCWLWFKMVSKRSLIVLASAVALLSHCLFLNSLFYPWVMSWWWLILGTE